MFTPPIAIGKPGPCGCGCALTPETSYGFAVDQFAREVLLAPLDPWQRWVAIHAGEMIRDANGIWRPRFRRLILLVARQNGKTHLLKVLALFWLFVQQIPMILGTSNLLDHAQEAMQDAHTMALESEILEEMLPRTGLRGLSRDNNKPGMRTTKGCRYRVSAATGNAGRSKTVHRWICDETLKHKDRETYKSAYYAMQAVRDAQAWFIGSQGDDQSVLLNELHAEALPYAEGKAADLDGSAVGLFEYSAPEDAVTDDPEALAMANPNMNHDHDHGVFGLESDARSKRLAGGQAEAGFRTESMCIRVKNLDPAVDPGAWRAGAREFVMPRDRRAAVVDISRNTRHVTLAIARQTPTGSVQVALKKAWDGDDAVKKMRAELPGLLRESSVKLLGYLPIGPGAIIFPDLNTKGRNEFRGVTIQAITAEMPALCMGFAEQVKADEIHHLDEPLLNQQVLAVGKKWSNDRWTFHTEDDGNKDAVNAAAGAVHLARMMPPPVGPVRLISAED